MLNVLSIDWDYFVDADADFRLTHFPDIPNENYPSSLQDVIWVSRYANDTALEKVGVDPAVRKVVQCLDKIPYIYVADSHKYAYVFVVQQLIQRGEGQVNLLNVDFHHDCRKDNDALDCGNWLSMLMKEYKGKYAWIGRKDSYLVGKPKKLAFRNRLDLSMLSRTEWDMLFVCRSDMWSPPHLDKEFTDIFRPLIDGKDGEIEHGIWDGRYGKMQNGIAEMRSVIKGINGKGKGAGK